MSCGAACARQLLRDAAIDVPESTIRADAAFDPLDGIDARTLASTLSKMHAEAAVPMTYGGGAVHEEQLGALVHRAPFLALLRMPAGKHWVIVDRIEAGIVHVRDPGGITGDNSGSGMEATMKLGVFLEKWKRAFNGTVYRL